MGLDTFGGILYYVYVYKSVVLNTNMRTCAQRLGEYILESEWSKSLKKKTDQL